MEQVNKISFRKPTLISLKPYKMKKRHLHQSDELQHLNLLTIPFIGKEKSKSTITK